MDLIAHVGLFLIVGAVIVFLASFYSDAEDGPALRSWPRRFLFFVLGCGVLTALMLLFEHTLASIH